MSTPYPCYLLTDPATAALDAALTTRWTVQADAPCAVQRSYLDTADGRLAAAGGALQLKRSGGVLGLVYEDLGNGKPLASRRVASAPAGLADIPPGVLHERLAPIVADRALHARVRVDAQVGGLRVLEDGATVARLLIESGECRGARDARPRPLATRVTLVPVAGASEAGRALQALLAAQPGVTPCACTRLGQALATLGRVAG